MGRPKLGHIQFINCLPLYYGMVKNDVLLDVDLVRADPADLAKMIVAGELDVAPIPRSSTRAMPTSSSCCPTSRSRATARCSRSCSSRRCLPSGSAMQARWPSPATRAPRRCSRASCSRTAGIPRPPTSRCRRTCRRCFATPTPHCSLATRQSAPTGSRRPRFTSTTSVPSGSRGPACRWSTRCGRTPHVGRVGARSGPGRRRRARRLARILPRASRRDIGVRRALGAIRRRPVPQLLRRAAVPLRAALPRGPHALPDEAASIGELESVPELRVFGEGS